MKFQADTENFDAEKFRSKFSPDIGLQMRPTSHCVFEAVQSPWKLMNALGRRPYAYLVSYETMKAVRLYGVQPSSIEYSY